VGIRTVNRQEAKKVVRAVHTSSQCNFHKGMFLPVVFSSFFFFSFFLFLSKDKKDVMTAKSSIQERSKRELEAIEGASYVAGSWLLGLFLWSSC